MLNNNTSYDELECFSLRPDPEALQEVIKVNSGQALVLANDVCDKIPNAFDMSLGYPTYRDYAPFQNVISN